jgi:hypothetical protein
MKAPHKPNNAVLAGSVGGQTTTFLESGNTAHEDQVSTPSQSQVMHADAGTKDGSFGIDVNFFHGWFLRDVLLGIEDILSDRDSCVRDHNINFAELFMCDFK